MSRNNNFILENIGQILQSRVFVVVRSRGFGKGRDDSHLPTIGRGVKWKEGREWTTYLPKGGGESLISKA